MARRLLSLLFVACACSAAGCGGDDEAVDATTLAIAPPNPDCRQVKKPMPRLPAMREALTTIMNANEHVDLVVKTSCGMFTITLEPQTSPNAVASFVALAEDDYFEGTYFHRIVPGFVIQGGDPTGTGTGGPGYTTVDTPGNATTYARGVVAMAKTPAEPRGAAGSQFFVVTGEAVQLPPDYAVIGRVTKGLDVVERIGELGDPTTEIPTQPVVIDEVLVERPSR
jgi:cyclophilin family peptidyl-prolyl cis-trans isomerase